MTRTDWQILLLARRALALALALVLVLVLVRDLTLKLRGLAAAALLQLVRVLPAMPALMTAIAAAAFAAAVPLPPRFGQPLLQMRKCGRRRRWPQRRLQRWLSATGRWRRSGSRKHNRVQLQQRRRRQMSALSRV